MDILHTAVASCMSHGTSLTPCHAYARLCCMQVDDMKAASEDELSQRFAAQPAAWVAALSLCAEHHHATQRLLHLATRHLLLHAPLLLVPPLATAPGPAPLPSTVLTSQEHSTGVSALAGSKPGFCLDGHQGSDLPIGGAFGGASAALQVGGHVAVASCTSRNPSAQAADATTAVLAAQALAQHKQVLRQSLFAEVRDRLVALVALADDLSDPLEAGTQ